jgi:hypothetical protein
MARTVQIFARAGNQLQAALGNDHVEIGRRDIDMSFTNARAVFRVHHRQRTGAAKDIRQKTAFVIRGVQHY